MREIKMNQARTLFIDDTGASQLARLEENIDQAFRWEGGGSHLIDDAHILADSIVFDLSSTN